MIPKRLILCLFLLPGVLSGVEFFSRTIGRDGLAWLDITLFTDSLLVNSQNTCRIRGYHTPFIKEGGFQVLNYKKTSSVGLDCSFQFHDLLASQEFDTQIIRHFTSQLTGYLALNWTRASTPETKAVHAFSLSWRLLLHPVPEFYTSLGYSFIPVLTLPKGGPALNTPAWFGTFGLDILPEFYLTAGVYCRDGFSPDWGWGTTFSAGQFTAWHAAWFSLSRALHASFSLSYRSWSFQWQCRWHPSIGLCYGSSVSREF
ncbi:MAG: hypothetical protein J7K63_05905 [Candidatus Marinimicrobia bacterium]|nr:hypothetical protein [Candidatus Neomarinimicrobiota bacterium]